MDVPIGRHWAHLPGLLAALEALAAHVEKVPRGAGALDAFRALSQQGAPQTQLARPEVLRPVVALVAIGGHPETARLAAQLLRGVAEAGGPACAAVRASGGIEALVRLAGRAAGGVDGMTRADALAAEAAVEALQAILACGAPAAAAAGTLLNPGEANFSNGAGERGWLAAAAAFRNAGGLPVAVALLAFGPDRCIVRDALAVLTALLCGEEAAVSDAVIDARAAAAAEFQAAGGLAALAGVVSAGGRSPCSESAVGKALRILKEVVAVSGAALPAVQEAGGIAAAISVLDSGTGNGAGANSGGADTTHPAQETLAEFGRHYQPLSSRSRSGNSNSNAARLSTDSAGTSRPPVAITVGCNSYDTAGSREIEAASEGGTDAPSDAGSGSLNPASTGCGGGGVPPSPSPAYMRAKASRAANAAMEGKAPLHWAAQFGEAAALRRLLGLALDVSSRDAAGNSPLHLAALNGHTECVRALLWAGADALAFNAGEALPLDLADTASPAWSLLEAELQWRTCLQASHPCELVWEGDDRPQPLLPGSRRDSPAGGGSGGGDAPRTPGADSNGFATAGSDAGSDAPETPPSRGSLTASDRAHTGMQCHFDALTGEVVVGECVRRLQPAAASLVGRVGKGKKGKRKEASPGLRSRLLRCACAGSSGELRAAAGRGEADTTMLLSYRLAAEPLDKLAVYVSLDTPDPVLGGKAAPQPQGAPVGLMVQLCSAAELAAAVQLMQARLHPDLAQAQALVAGLRERQAEHAIGNGRHGREADAALARHVNEAKRALDALLQEARRLEAQFSTHSLRRAGPLPRSVARRRDRASLHARLLGSYLAALDQPPPPGAALSVAELEARVGLVASPRRELGAGRLDAGASLLLPARQSSTPRSPGSPLAGHAIEPKSLGDRFTAAGEEPGPDSPAVLGSPPAIGCVSASSSVGVSGRPKSIGSPAGTRRRSATSGSVQRPSEIDYRANIAALSDEFRSIAKRVAWTKPQQPPLQTEPLAPPTGALSERQSDAGDAQAGASARPAATSPTTLAAGGGRKQDSAGKQDAVGKQKENDPPPAPRTPPPLGKTAPAAKAVSVSVSVGPVPPPLPPAKVMKGLPASGATGAGRGSKSSAGTTRGGVASRLEAAGDRRRSGGAGGAAVAGAAAAGAATISPHGSRRASTATEPSTGRGRRLRSGSGMTGSSGTNVSSEQKRATTAQLPRWK